MRKFIKRSLFFLLPVYVALFTYFVLDPFKVLYKKDFSTPSSVTLNRDFVTTEKFIDNYPLQNYNSFIFGSSRTLAYKTKAWKHYLASSDKPFVFDASGETIYGIWTKFNYLKKEGVPIKNALIVLCPDVTFSKADNYNDHIRIKHPITSGESKLKFHYLFIKSYFTDGFFVKYLDYLIFQTKRDYLKGYIEFRNIYSDLKTNDLYIGDLEKEIRKDSIKYYEKKKAIFYPRTTEQQCYPVQINKQKAKMLMDIKQILSENGSNYKIVISPLYEQHKLHYQDLNTLKKIFSVQNIYDFSGINDITNSKFNYFEDSHYRYCIGEKIMNEIYSR